MTVDVLGFIGTACRKMDNPYDNEIGTEHDMQCSVIR